jgi:putative chitinase
MDEEVFAQAAGIPIARAELVWPYMLDAMNEFDILGVQRMAAFIAQTAHESANYTQLREDTYYRTAEQIMDIFPSYFGAGKADPMDYIRSSKKLANYVYANRGGNGDYDSGDGWMYRAGGYIGITFLNGYQWMSELLGLPLVEQPELIESHEVAARTAGAYWANTQWQGMTLNDYADAWNIRGISGLINRGSPNKTAAGLLDRTKRSERALTVIRKLTSI